MNRSKTSQALLCAPLTLSTAQSAPTGSTDGPKRSAEGDAAILTKPKSKSKRPPLYVVVMHNDDYTTVDFVMMVLMGVFHKSFEEAFVLMQEVHQLGKGRAGVYPYDVAQTKAAQVRQLAELHEMPLRMSVEPEG